MNAMTRWNPFQEMEELHNRISSLLEPASSRRWLGQENLAGEWAPLVDIVESDKEYLIKAELPGLKKEDVKVTFENGTLAIAGERKFEKEEKGKRYHRVESTYGSFMRSFVLPADTDPSKIDAEFKDGVLHVHVAKSETAKPKQINVKAS